MPVNEGETKFQSFLTTIEDTLMDEVCLLQDGVIKLLSKAAKAIEPDKQSSDVDPKLAYKKKTTKDKAVIIESDAIVPIDN